MNTSLALTLLAAAALLLLAWQRLRLDGLLLLALGSALIGLAPLLQPMLAEAGDAPMAWQALQGALQAGPVLLAGGAWSLFAGGRWGRRRSDPITRSLTARLTHVGLRLVVTFLVVVLASMFLLLAAGALQAAPQLLAHALAALVLLLVWSLWPLLDRPHPAEHSPTTPPPQQPSHP